MRKFVKVARIAKVRKRQGRLVVQCCDGLPFLLEAGMTAHVVPPSLDVPRTVVLSEAQEEVDCVVAFQGVTDYADLVEYVGRYLLVARDELDEEALQAAPAAALGFDVVDARFGGLGRLVEVLDNGFQATLVVEGIRGQMLVPAVDEFIEHIDFDRGSIRTRVPDGLVDIAQPIARREA